MILILDTRLPLAGSLTFYGIYTDLDIVNCNATLLQQLYQSEGYSTEHLKRYIEDRCQLCQDMGIEKDDIKKLVYGLIYKPKNFNSANDFTNCDKDFLTVQQFNYILKESSLGHMSISKAKTWLKKMGVVERQKKLGPDNKNTKIYKGIKQISDYNEFNDYENVVNVLDEIN